MQSTNFWNFKFCTLFRTSAERKRKGDIKRLRMVEKDRERERYRGRKKGKRERDREENMI